ncbi:TPA: murein biosynthesis integral membrane protein MurJ [Candidatus Acetothermia bacterium]|nr:murein biosynthesis integral membrane protein MurJ [Candidatus Acetothermia bacterium]
MKRLWQNISLIVLATSISRIFGLLRDVIIANRFGAGVLYDAFLIAYFFPHFLRRLLAEGALSAAFIPVFAELLVIMGKEEAGKFANNVLTILLLLFPFLIAGGILFAPQYVPLLASGFARQELGLAISLSRFIFPYIGLMGIAAILTGILHGYQRFFFPALAPVLFNLGVISGAVWIAPRLASPIHGLALGVIIGGIGQLVIQIPALYRLGFRFRPMILPFHPGIKKVRRLMMPAVIGLAVMQINILVDNRLASYLAPGAISSLQFAMRLFQLPLGLFAVSISTAIFPHLSTFLARKEYDKFTAILTTGIGLTVFVLLPAMAGLYALGGNIIRLLFEHGRFTPTDTVRTVNVLYFYLIGLASYGLVFLFTRAFYALGKPRIPLIASSIAVIVNIVFNYLLIGAMQASGLALATALSGLVNMGILAFFLLQPKSDKTEIKIDHHLRRNIIHTIIGSALTFLLTHVAAQLIAIYTTSEIVLVFGPLLIGLSSYLLYAWRSGIYREFFPGMKLGQ